jgi:hypothetical protein
MEPGDTLSCSQEPATGPYPEPKTDLSKEIWMGTERVIGLVTWSHYDGGDISSVLA